MIGGRKDTVYAYTAEDFGDLKASVTCLKQDISGITLPCCARPSLQKQYKDRKELADCLTNSYAIYEKKYGDKTNEIVRSESGIDFSPDDMIETINFLVTSIQSELSKNFLRRKPNTHVLGNLGVYKKLEEKYPIWVTQLFESIESVDDIPSVRCENDMIQEKLLSSADQLRESNEVFYMNSCLPGTLLLIDELKNEYPEIASTAELYIDMYIPDREDYKTQDNTSYPTMHFALQGSHNDQQWSCQFFQRSWYIGKGKYINPEEHIQRLRSPFVLPIERISGSDGLNAILHSLYAYYPKNEVEMVLEMLEKNIDTLVKKLQSDNTEEEFLKEHNQEFVKRTSVYLSV